jgi:hypothetical protein
MRRKKNMKRTSVQFVCLLPVGVEFPAAIRQNWLGPTKAETSALVSWGLQAEAFGVGDGD